MATCSKCGTAVAESNVLYTASADIVCAACYAQADIVETDKRAARNIVNAASASLIAGFISIFFNILFAPMIIAFTSGAYAMKSLLPGNERFTQHLSKGTTLGVWIMAGLGILFAGFRVLVELAVFNFMMKR